MLYRTKNNYKPINQICKNNFTNYKSNKNAEITVIAITNPR